jgi:predicted MPP superfamily phosphohydrolase
MLMCICGVMMIYGYFEALDVRVEHLVVRTDKLPVHVQSLRIAQISDVHLGIINRDRELKRIMDVVKDLSPDMLVSTGDLVDGSMHNLMHLSELIKQVDPPFGKYAVTGNHEYYAGLDHAVSFMEKAGFEVLRHEVRTVANLVNVGGIDDGGRARRVDDGDTLSKIQNNLFTLYLKHRPRISSKTVGFFDLQLSGHTHNGQIWPFNYLVSLEFPMIKGLYELEKGSKLYINRGTGTWGPPIRVFSPPEITLIELRRK